MLLVAIPSATVAPTLAAARAAAGPAPVVVCASKGLHPATGDTMAAVIGAAMPGARVGVLSGPSFAQEIASGRPAALVAASADAAVATAVQVCFSGGAGPAQGTTEYRAGPDRLSLAKPV